MILWFAACAVMGAWSVLRDQSFDYRLIAVGALLPDLIDVGFGHRALAHTLAFAVGGLALVMAVTVNRRPVRKKLIALPIGLLAHLVLDFVFAQQRLFWWPFFGSWRSYAVFPSPIVLVVRELIGVVVAVQIVRRFGLADKDRRAEFLRTGRITPC